MLERRRHVDPDLEAVDSGEEPGTEPGVGVEHEHVVLGTTDAGQHLDLPGRVENQSPPRRPDPQISDLLRDLGLQIRLRIGTGHDDRVPGAIVDAGGGLVHGVVGVHTASLPWHTANDMSDDDAIFPDSIEGPDDDRSALDQLAERAVDALLGLLRRANALAGGVLIFASAAGVLSYLLGIAALSGGARTAWIALGGVGVVVGVGSVLLSMWRLWMVRRGSDALVDEIRRFIGGDDEAERTVLETVEVTEISGDDSVVQVSRQFFTMRDGVDRRAADFPELSTALRSLTSFPGLMALAVVTGFGFALVSPIFLLILIF